MGEGLSYNWAAAAAATRWLLYASMLIASGSTLFSMLMRPPPVVAAVAARIGRVAAVAAAPTYVLAVGIGGAEMLDGEAGVIFTAAAWELGLASSLGLSAAIGVPAMAFLWLGFRRENAPVQGFGVALAILSFLVTGHAATAPPMWLLAPVVGVHLLCAAFWLGALPPLFMATHVLPTAEAGALLARFSKLAISAVVVLVLSGLAISAVQVTSPAALLTTDYGHRLLTKLGLVAMLIGLAAFNRGVLTPRLLRERAGGGGSMRWSIALEVALQALILAAAVSLTLVAPPRTLG